MEGMSTRTYITRIKDAFLSILFPPICIVCNVYVPEPHSPLCDACKSSIICNTALLCPICETRLSMNKRICNHSQQDRICFPYLLGAATHYDDPTTKEIIHTYKYRKIHALTDICVDLLLTYIDQLDPQPSLLKTDPIVISIPLHPKKKRERGFNQSALIAQEFARRKNLSYAESLIKTRYDNPQAKTKTHTERFDRMHGAFTIPFPEEVQNKNIILVDDVSTSGATLSQAAQTLKAAGAKQILALVIAKA